MSELAAPAAAPNGAPRNNSGQFAPKAGATGVAPQEGAALVGDGAPPSGPQSLEQWNVVEGEVDVYGEKQKVKWGSKAEALREAQELRAYRKRNREIAERERKIASFERMSPEERAEALGLDVSEVARKKVIEAARRIDEEDRLKQLPPEIAQQLREAQEARSERDQLRAEREAEKQRAEHEAKTAEAKQRRQQAVSGLEKGLELTGLPKTHATMAILAEIQQEATSTPPYLPLPPDLLAAEANKRYNERGVEPLKKMTGKTLLDRLGPDVVRAVLMAERERRGLAAMQPRQAASIPAGERLPEPDSGQVFGEGEAEKRLRAMRNRS